MTRPVLTKNSVCTAGLSHSGVPTVLEIEQAKPEREDDVLDAPVDEQPVAGEEARAERERENDGKSEQERRDARADQRDAERADDQEADADSSRPSADWRCVNTLSVDAAAWPRISVPSAPGSVREPSRGELAGGCLDLLAVLRGERGLQVAARA